MARIIFTHTQPDMDALLSIWVVRTFFPGMANAHIQFRPANWNGRGMQPDDIAVDMEAGGRGIKGQKKDGLVMSAFATLMMSEHVPTESQQALRHLISYMDLQDSKGNAIQYLCPDITQENAEILYFISIQSVLVALKTTHRNDIKVYYRIAEIMDGLHTVTLNNLRTERNLDDFCEVLHDGKVAINYSGKRNVNAILFNKMSVDVIVYIDGNNIGLVRRGGPDGIDVRMDHPDIKAVVAASGDDPEEWFAHDSGFLFCRGSKKNAVPTPSNVDPHDLADAAVKLL